MQLALDSIKVQGLYAYALTASGGVGCNILGRFVDLYGATVYSKTWTLSSTASSLTTLYRDVSGSPSALLADSPTIQSFIADISSGSVRVRFNGNEDGTLGAAGRNVDVATGSFRLGAPPKVNHRVLGPGNDSYTRCLSFQNVSVGSSATKIITSPSVGRRAVELYNPNSGTYLFIGYDSTVDTTSKHTRRLAPNTTTVVSAGDGLDIYVAASAAGATISFAEMA